MNASQGMSMTNPTYYSPQGGLPPQTQLLSDRAVFTTAYAVIPKGVMQDIVTSALPHWKNTRASLQGHFQVLPKPSRSTSWK
jgi:glyoxylate utilization-related uncharacterized protein